jgi:hypothetical protein
MKMVFRGAGAVTPSHPAWILWMIEVGGVTKAVTKGNKKRHKTAKAERQSGNTEKLTN